MIIFKLYILIKNFINRIMEDNVGVYAAQASFFIILSVFPLIMLVITIVGMTSIPQDIINSIANGLLPETFSVFITDLLTELSESSSGTVLSITAIVALWSASNGVLAIMRGLLSIYHIKDNRHYIIKRSISALYTIIFVVIIVFSLAGLVFGNKLYLLLKTVSPVAYNILGIFIGSRALISLCILILFFLLMYRIVRNTTYSLLDLFPGALFSACGWLLFSFAFSIYVDNFGRYSYMYGSLTTIILLMLWLYVCVYIAFIGAEVNVFIKEKLQKFKRIHQYRKANK